MAVQRRVLVVDDEQPITNLLARLLPKAGFEVDALNDPTRAIDELARGRCRVVVTDLWMPTLDGVSVIQRIKAYDGSVPVVVLTGHSTFSNLTAAFHAGAEAVVLKPLAKIDELAAALTRCFEKLDHWHEMIRYIRTRTA